MYVLYKEKIIICVMQEKNSGPRACWVSTLNIPTQTQEKERTNLVWILTGKHLVWYDLVKL